MFYGFVKHIMFDRGFGFIGQEGGPDVYFHASIMGDETFMRLQLDQPVMFELAKRDPDEKPTERKARQAAVVKLIARMPGGILPPPPQKMMAQRHPKAKGRKATWKRRIEVDPNKSTPLPAKPPELDPPAT